jgi:hypothetical protein
VRLHTHQFQAHDPNLKPPPILIARSEWVLGAQFRSKCGASVAPSKSYEFGLTCG